MPPGFMNAITAPPNTGAEVASSCESAIMLPSGDSPSASGSPPGSRVESSVSVIVPTTTLASGAACGDVLVDDRLNLRVRRHQLRTGVTPVPGVLVALRMSMLSALMEISLSFWSSIVSVMSLRTRPNDDALVIRRVTPPVVIVQRYSACV